MMPGELKNGASVLIAFALLVVGGGELTRNLWPAHAQEARKSPPPTPPQPSGPAGNSGGQNVSGPVTNNGPVYNGPVTVQGPSPPPAKAPKSAPAPKPINTVPPTCTPEQVQAAAGMGASGIANIGSNVTGAQTGVGKNSILNLCSNIHAPQKSNTTGSDFPAPGQPEKPAIPTTDAYGNPCRRIILNQQIHSNWVDNQAGATFGWDLGPGDCVANQSVTNNTGLTVHNAGAGVGAQQSSGNHPLFPDHPTDQAFAVVQERQREYAIAMAFHKEWISNNSSTSRTDISADEVDFINTKLRKNQEKFRIATGPYPGSVVFMPEAITPPSAAARHP